MSMASQNEPHPIVDDPIHTVNGLLDIVESIHEHFIPKMEIRLARSNNEEEWNETDSLPTAISLPNLDSTDDFSDGLHIARLIRYLRLVKAKLLNLQELREEVNEELHRHFPLLNELVIQEQKCRKSLGVSFQITKGNKNNVVGITRKISDLVAKVPPLPYNRARQKTLFSLDQENCYEVNNGKCIENLPGLHEIGGLTQFEAFRQVEQKFMELSDTRKICLLSFAVFPENREVHRTMLMYWWIGEGILPVEGAEEAVREVLKDFTDKKLVEPVKERRKVAPSSYKMNPFLHSSVILLSNKIGLFDIYRERKMPRMNKSKMGKVCLVKGSSSQEEAGAKRMPTLDIETVFNVSEIDPEFTLKWFLEHPSDRKLIKLSKTVFKSLHVFYLGRWERTQKRQIQIRNPELMKGLKDMKNLRVLSFQGISSISRLKSSVCKLHKLIVLDLRDCSDLTKLPEKIDSLRSLVYLDMTGCYMLEWIPFRLALLKNLEVLKGFVVSDTMYKGVACTLSLLKKLKKLRKLSIEIHRDDLGVHQLMVDLVKLKALKSLKVTWRRDLNINYAGNPEDFTKIKAFPHQLKKLDLQRFPHEQLPIWLQPQNLLHLKKLHIGGAKKLKGFGDLPEKATQCAVEVLRLTSLPRLRIGWIELKQIQFPNLTFLEKYECPRVSLTPCDGYGIWRSDQD